MDDVEINTDLDLEKNVTMMPNINNLIQRNKITLMGFKIY